MKEAMGRRKYKDRLCNRKQKKKRYTNREYAIVLNNMNYYDLNILEHQLEGTDKKNIIYNLDKQDNTSEALH